MKVQLPFFIDGKPLEPDEETAAAFAALAMKDIAAFNDLKRAYWQARVPILLIFGLLSLIIMFAGPSALPVGLIGAVLTAALAAGFSHSISKRTLSKPIEGIGKFYWRLELVPYRDGSIMLDLSSIIPKAHYRYIFLGQDDMRELERLRDEAGHLYADKSLFLDPAVKEQVDDEFSVYGTEKGLADISRSAERVLANAKEKDDRLPIVPPYSILSTSVGNLLSSATDWVPEPEASVLEDEKVDDVMGRFHELSGLADKNDSVPIDQEASDWMDQIAAFATQHEDLINYSLREAMRPYQKSVLDDGRNISQHHYCPQCHAEVSQGLRTDFESYSFDENTRMDYDAATGVWTCPLCRFQTDRPLSIPRIFDEVIFPVAKALMLEHKTERLRIYSDIENQKSALKTNFENNLEQAFQINRSGIEAADARVRALRSGIIQDVQMATTLLAELQRYKRIGADRHRDYEAAINSIRSRIEENTADSVRRFGSLMESIQNRTHREMEDNVKLARDLEQKRDRQFLISTAAAKGEHVSINNDHGHASVTYHGKDGDVRVDL